MDMDSGDPRKLRYNVMKLEEALGMQFPKWTFGKTIAKNGS